MIGGGARASAIFWFSLTLLILSFALFAFFSFYAKANEEDTPDIVKQIWEFSANGYYGIIIFGILTVLTGLFAFFTRTNRPRYSYPPSSYYY